MNQKSLSYVTLYGPPNASVAVVTTGSAIDVGATYANVQRREAKVLAQANFGSNTTSLSIQIWECATTNGTYTTATNGALTAITTSGVFTAGHVTLSKRYVKAELTPAGTTAAVIAHVGILLENRQT